MQLCSFGLILVPREPKPREVEGTLCPRPLPFLTVSYASGSWIPSPGRLELSVTPAGHSPEAWGTAVAPASWSGLWTPVPSSRPRRASPGAHTHTNPLRVFQLSREASCHARRTSSRSIDCSRGRARVASWSKRSPGPGGPGSPSSSSCSSARVTELSSLKKWTHLLFTKFLPPLGRAGLAPCKI